MVSSRVYNALTAAHIVRCIVDLHRPVLVNKIFVEIQLVKIQILRGIDTRGQCMLFSENLAQMRQ